MAREEDGDDGDAAGADDGPISSAKPATVEQPSAQEGRML
jgi:hypothetical protein